MNKLLFIFRYLNYLFTSKTRYRIHSPFIYDFVNKVLRDKTSYPDYNKLWDNRNNLAQRNDQIETVDFGSGAGSKQYRTKYLPLKKIVKLRTHPKKRLELLYRISKFSSPGTILEFGTAAGISATYLKSGNPDARLITMEGCANLASHADERFNELKLDDIVIKVGNFDTNLKNVLMDFTRLDLVFFDGNHREEPTLRYYEECVQLSNESSIFVFDDIHWSSGMEKAWNRIKEDPRVSVTIDLFWFGLVFFRKGIEKQDFVIRY